jgi:tetratricopeptide (TPR) repeat protein
VDTDLAWLSLGELYLRSGFPSEAETALTQAISRNDASAQAYALRAEARLHLGDWAGAELDARTANFLSTTERNLSTNGWYVLGRVAEESGDIEGACTYYSRDLPFIIHSFSWERSVYRRSGNFFLLMELPAPPLHDLVTLERFGDICQD